MATIEFPCAVVSFTGRLFNEVVSSGGWKLWSNITSDVLRRLRAPAGMSYFNTTDNRVSSGHRVHYHSGEGLLGCPAQLRSSSKSLLGGWGGDVRGVAPVSCDPPPRVLWSWSGPHRGWGTASGRRCIHCHKSTFLHKRVTENRAQNTGSAWVGSSVP